MNNSDCFILRSLFCCVSDVDKGYDIGVIECLWKESRNINFDWSNVTKLYAVGFDGLRLPEVYLQADFTYDVSYTKRVDFETKYEEDEDRTEENLLPELRANAEAYLLENKFPKVAYEVKSDINQTLEIGDTIYVKHPLVMLVTEVQEYEYNILTQRVIKIVFGNYNRSVKKRFDKIKTDIEDVKKQTSKFEVIVGDQTDLINNLNKFGHVYIDDNQILILDALPKETAQNVWRWNLGGLGFSSTGIEGPFKQAWTMDGVFNTDFIAANSIMANQLSSDVGSSLDLSSNEAINLLVRKDGIIGGINATPETVKIKSSVLDFNNAVGNNVDLTGKITADEGKIGGYTISGNNLVGNEVTLKPSEIEIGGVTFNNPSDTTVLDATLIGLNLIPRESSSWASLRFGGSTSILYNKTSGNISANFDSVQVGTGGIQSDGAIIDKNGNEVVSFNETVQLTLNGGWTGDLTYYRLGSNIGAIRGSITSPSNVTGRDVISIMPSEARPPHNIHTFTAYSVSLARVITFGSILDNRNIRIESTQDGTLGVSSNHSYQINTVFYTY